ncbi:MAG: hypothetical protein C00003105_01806 [ANME-2 cluster archaeon HR1]|nr:MAG: hypothetical protein C00003105_01806 [ANME-2 cluster archaeon HR1]
MKNQVTSSEIVNSVTNNANLLGFYAAILTTVITVVTFGIAIFTPPISGAFCVGSCIEYPFTNIVSRFPRDYVWMYLAILLTLIYVVLMVCIHRYASKEKKIFSQIGLSFALISATILIINYFIQISVIQPSLVNGETDGIAILTAYNPHGIFIALEEIGYLMMSVSFFCVAPVFSGTNRLESAIRWIFVISFILIIISLIILSFFYGINREDRFEVVVITINWIVLIVSGILLSVVFKRAMKMPS